MAFQQHSVTTYSSQVALSNQLGGALNPNFQHQQAPQMRQQQNGQMIHQLLPQQYYQPSQQFQPDYQPQLQPQLQQPQLQQPQQIGRASCRERVCQYV